MTIVKSKRTVPNRPRKTGNQNGKPIIKQTGQQITTEIPLMVATTTYQSAQRGVVHRETFDEIVGNLTIGPTTPPGEVVSFQLDPTVLPNSSRFATMSLLYSQYRVLNGQYRVGYNFSTATTGNAIHGFSKNPDYDVNEGDYSAIYNLFGGQDSRFYTPCNVPIDVDSTKWYNVDPDTPERMMCSAGAFFVMVMTPPSTTGPVTVPVFFRGTVEFRSPARQKSPKTNVMQIFPSVSIKTVAQGTGSSPTTAELTVLQGEPPLPPMDLDAVYAINPQYSVNVSEEEIPDGIIVQYIRKIGNNPNAGYSFYENQDDALNNKSIQVKLSAIPNINVLPRTTIQLN